MNQLKLLLLVTNTWPDITCDSYPALGLTNLKELNLAKCSGIQGPSLRKLVGNFSGPCVPNHFSSLLVAALSSLEDLNLSDIEHLSDEKCEFVAGTEGNLFIFLFLSQSLSLSFSLSSSLLLLFFSLPSLPYSLFFPL